MNGWGDLCRDKIVNIVGRNLVPGDILSPGQVKKTQVLFRNRSYVFARDHDVVDERMLVIRRRLLAAVIDIHPDLLDA